LVDADFPRVDLVGKGANGIPRFLIAKQDGESAGLLDPGFVRSLIGKQAEPEPRSEERVTMTGSPAAIAKLIHGAPVRQSLKEAPVSRTASDPVTKDVGPELDDGPDGMDPTVPLAAPEDDAPGDPTDPGSPAWEAIDAATAQKWTSIAVRLKNALAIMAEREMLEAAGGDSDDAESAWDLQDAQCAVDYVIGILAGFAVGEQAEADLGAESMAAIGKAMADDTLPGALFTLESLGAVIRKSGRVLSSVNEAEIRSAAASLNKVLSTLPMAPVADDIAKEKETAVADAQTETKPEDVAKADESAAEPAADAVPAEVAKDAQGPAESAPDGAEAPVAKADAEPADGGKPEQVAVYDSEGNLVGVADPADITPLSNVKAPAKNEGEPEPPADPADMTPAPAAEAGTPADGVAKESQETAAGLPEDPQDVLKSIVTAAMSEVLGSDPAREDIRKQAEVIAAQSGEIEALKARLETVESNPAAPKVFTNGQTPPAHQMRGQDHGSREVDVAKARERKAELYAADAPEQARIAKEMQEDAIGIYAAMRAGR
jgi:hypothetical protein